MRIAHVKLWYVGMSSRSGARDYQFIVQSGDDDGREVTLSIEDAIFSKRQLSFQEAPDFCYQKLQEKLENEATEGPIRKREPVTALDVTRYRDSHEIPKRGSPGSRRSAT